MFYSEQLSIVSREKSMEEKARSIRDIVVAKEMEAKQERLRRMQLVMIEPHREKVVEEAKEGDEG